MDGEFRRSSNELWTMCCVGVRVATTRVHDLEWYTDSYLVPVNSCAMPLFRRRSFVRNCKNSRDDKRRGFDGPPPEVGPVSSILSALEYAVIVYTGVSYEPFILGPELDQVETTSAALYDLFGRAGCDKALHDAHGAAKYGGGAHRVEVRAWQHLS